MPGTGLGTLAISVDLELFWGVHDKRTLAAYGPSILGARDAILRLLERFSSDHVQCTWATVGLLFFDDKEELLHYLPAERPRYANPLLSPYRLLPEIGANEREDPYHYGLSLVRRIKACPGQEIGTHTFSHYYCLEKGQTPENFRADLIAAQRAAERIGITLRTLVFPRNQASLPHLRIARDIGLAAYRGNQRSWLYRAERGEGESRLKRAGRLADAYVPVTGANCLRPRRDPSGMIDIPASRFLRPVSRRLRVLEGRRLKRIKDSMSDAARTGTLYHVWFHAHNFGRDVDPNLELVDSILAHFKDLRERHGMQSRTMADIAADLETSDVVGHPVAADAATRGHAEAS